MRADRRGFLTIVLAVAVAALPPLVDLAVSDRRRPFGYLAADAFYYLTVARNIAERGLVSFDGSQLTNGFHPLWQAGVALLHALVHAVSARPDAILAVALLANIALLAVALVFLGLAARRPDGSVSPLFVLAPVGAYALVVWPLWLRFGRGGLAGQNPMEGSEPVYGTLWSYVNGMETALVLAFFGLALFVVATRSVLDSRREAIAFGATLAGLTLSRLDQGVIAAALFLALAPSATTWARRQRAAYAFAAFSLPLLACLAVNRVVFGSAIPTSGILKTSFPHLTSGNLENLASVWRSRGAPAAGWLFCAWRAAQILVPALVGCVFGLASIRVQRARPWLRLRDGLSRFEQSLVFVTVGVVALAAYNFLYVFTFAQGHWYFPVSTTYVTLVAIALADRIRWPASVSTRIGGAVTIAAAAISIALFVPMQRRLDYHARYATFLYEEVPRMRAFYGNAAPNLVDFDDGIVAFATGYPTMSGSGLMLDWRAVRAAQRGRLGELAVARGFNRFTSVIYFDFRALKQNTSSDDIRDYMKQTRLGGFGDPSRYVFSVEYKSSATNFAIIRADPIPTR